MFQPILRVADTQEAESLHLMWRSLMVERGSVKAEVVGSSPTATEDLEGFLSQPYQITGCSTKLQKEELSN